MVIPWQDLHKDIQNIKEISNTFLNFIHVKHELVTHEMELANTSEMGYIKISRHCAKYQNFTLFPGAKILWECTIFEEFPGIHPKICGNFVFLQNFYTRKLDEITICYAVYNIIKLTIIHQIAVIIK